MIESRSVTLVVPCFNEAQRLDSTAFLQALRDMPWLSLCFVDDGSTDATGNVLQAMQWEEPSRIDILTLGANCGKAEAVRRGLLRVASGESGTLPQLCGFWDADLSAPLAEVPRLVSVFDVEPSVQWVFAIRLRALGRSVTRQGLRHYLGRLFATATSLMLGVGVYDTQCGAKLFRVDSLLREVVADRFVSRWIFDVELLSRADALLKARSAGTVLDAVYEEPLREWHHRTGSRLTATDFLRSGVDLVRIKRDQHQWRRASAPAEVPQPQSASLPG